MLKYIFLLISKLMIGFVAIALVHVACKPECKEMRKINISMASILTIICVWITYLQFVS